MIQASKFLDITSARARTNHWQELRYFDEWFREKEQLDELNAASKLIDTK